MKKLLIGNFGAGNVGDELILLSALETYPESVVMTSNEAVSQSFSEKTFSTIPFPPTGVRSFIKSKTTDEKFDTKALYDDLDEIVFVGGGLFAIKSKAYWIWYQLLAWCTKNFAGVPIRMEYQGVDDSRNPVLQRVLRKAFKLVQTISVRDIPSKDTVEKYSMHKAKMVGDRVEMWLLENKERLIQKTEPNIKTRVLVNAIDDCDLELLEKQYGGEEYEIVFLKMDSKDFVPKDTDTVKYQSVYPQTAKEVFGVFNAADIVVGERFHSLVLGEFFCGRDHTLCLRKPYSEKVSDFLVRKSLDKLTEEKISYTDILLEEQGQSVKGNNLDK